MAKRKKKKIKIIKNILKVILLIALVTAYGHFIEPKIITHKEYNIKIENLTSNFEGFKIVHISDIHYGRVFDKKQMRKLINSINAQKPDIVVLTGDLIDKDTKINENIVKEISSELAKIETVAGKYAINGNHDLKFDEWTNIISNSGFKNLNNTYDTIYKNGYNFMVIAGASTFKDKQSINDKLKPALDYINAFDKDGPFYNILIMHEPDYIDDLIDNKFNLILAGHSHAGQTRTPFGPIILPNGATKYYESNYKLENSDLYISNGLGVSSYNFRLFNTPSYNIYKLTK